MIGEVLNPEQVKEQWWQIAPLLALAVSKNDGELLLEDIPKLVVDRQMFIGVVREAPGEEIQLVLAGDVVIYPRKKVLNVAFVGGKPLVQSRAKHLYPVLEDIARKLGCTTIQGQCGPGATRFYTRLMGMTPTYTILRKEVT